MQLAPLQGAGPARYRHRGAIAEPEAGLRERLLANRGRRPRRDLAHVRLTGRGDRRGFERRAPLVHTRRRQPEVGNPRDVRRKRQAEVADELALPRQTPQRVPRRRRVDVEAIHARVARWRACVGCSS